MLIDSRCDIGRSFSSSPHDGEVSTINRPDAQILVSTGRTHYFRHAEPNRDRVHHSLRNILRLDLQASSQGVKRAQNV